MTDIMKPKIMTEKVNIQTADPKANASVFLFFSNAHFLRTILAKRTNGTFGFAWHTSRPFAKPKDPFFANTLVRLCINKTITFKPNNIIIWH